MGPTFHDWIKADDVHNPSFPQEYLSCLVQSSEGLIALGFWVRQSVDGDPVNSWFTTAPNQAPVPVSFTVAFVATFKSYGDNQHIA